MINIYYRNQERAPISGFLLFKHTSSELFYGILGKIWLNHTTFLFRPRLAVRPVVAPAVAVVAAEVALLAAVTIGAAATDCSRGVSLPLPSTPHNCDIHFCLTSVTASCCVIPLFLSRTVNVSCFCLNSVKNLPS